MSIDPAELRRRNREIWSTGDFPTVAPYIARAGEVLVERAGIGPGMRVLDVGAGSGNVAIPAALAGAEVVGSDLTAAMFPAGRRRAAEAGVSVEWVEGDAEDLPFPDASFDAVLSSFGMIFAPRHRVAAAELARVCRPDGVIGFTSWTPEGLGGACFRISARYAPPLPPFASPPLLWGEERHVREMLEPDGFVPRFERFVVTLPFDGEGWMRLVERNVGGFVLAKANFDPGDWARMRAELVATVDEASVVRDGMTVFEQEFLLTVARRT